MFGVITAAVLLFANLSGLKAENYITTDYGEPVTTKSASLTLGRHGPLLIEDTVFIEELARFVRERVPDRVVHSGGTGALGYFEVTNDITKFCDADLFSEIGKRTPVIVRFASTFGDKGQPSTARDLRAFSIKFYTQEGNWDIVGLNLPVLGVRDPAFFGTITHTFKPQPTNYVVDFNAAFDAVTIRTETANFLTYFLSDLTIPYSFRYMDGFGISVLKLINKRGKQFYAKFSYFTDQGIRNCTATEAAELQVSNPGHYFTDLYEAIEAGNYPSWTFKVQILSEKQFKKFPFDPLDNTKIWPEKLAPYIEIGKIVLNENPRNQFAQIEQLAMSPSNLVPGIRASPDKVLLSRMIGYPDAQRYRIGTNYLQLPVNRPLDTVRNYARDGHMVYNNQGNSTNYYPNSYDNLTISERAVKLSPRYYLSGWADRYDTGDEDNYSQPRFYFEKTLDDSQRLNLATTAANFVSALKPDIKVRALEYFGNISNLLRTMVEEILEKSTTTS